MQRFKLKIENVIPIGLDGEDQRPIHTNMVGRIVSGVLEPDELVDVPVKGGEYSRVAVKFADVYEGRRRVDGLKYLSVEEHSHLSCCCVYGYRRKSQVLSI